LVVKVCLHTSLQRRTAAGPVRHLDVELPAAATLADLLAALDIRTDLKTLLRVVNGRTADPRQVLEEADDVHLIPALSGG
jgi:sulfur carrier protein ThiS